MSHCVSLFFFKWGGNKRCWVVCCTADQSVGYPINLSVKVEGKAKIKSYIPVEELASMKVEVGLIEENSDPMIYILL